MATNKLTATKVDKAKQPGLHNDGGGLYLKVTAAGTKSWIFRFRDRRTRKLRDMGIGPYPDVPLATTKRPDGETIVGARERARDARLLLLDGTDPIEVRHAERRARLAEAQTHVSKTFDEAAEAAYKAKSAEFRNTKHAKQWIGTLSTYASPVIGNMDVSEIEPKHVHKVLEPIWTTKTETASRVRQRVEAVLSWAAAAGYRSGDNPARWRGNLEHMLPQATKVKKKSGGAGNHHAALPVGELPAFMDDLRTREGMSARALEFLILTAARSGEVRLATWDEFDLDARIWTVPGERMKGGRPHRVPLTDAAVELLSELPRVEGSEYVFPAARGGALSDMSISAVCRRMHDASIKVGGKGYLDPTIKDPNRVPIATPHGFRSTFKDWARTRTSYADEVSELALAHVNSDATRAAYARDELLELRADMMASWAQYCGSTTQAGNVTPITKASA